MWISLYISLKFVYEPICLSHCTCLGIWWIYCVSLSAPILWSICLLLFGCPLVNFTVKSDCDKINFVLFVISVIIILVKVLQMIWDYITSFKMCQTSCQSLCLCLWKICISHHDGVMLSVSYFSKTRNCSNKQVTLNFHAILKVKHATLTKHVIFIL